jgi:hypothetical protein
MMMRYADFSNMPIAKIEHDVVSMEEAITAYRNGARVGIINPLSGNGVLMMDKGANFTTDFDYLVNCQWVILN